MAGKSPSKRPPFVATFSKLAALEKEWEDASQQGKVAANALIAVNADLE